MNNIIDKTNKMIQGYTPKINNSNNMFYPSIPNINIGQSQLPYPTSNITQGTPLSDLINKLSSYLAPEKAFTQDVMPYDNYASPQRAVLDQWVKMNYRPEFERNTLNPFKQDYAGRAGAGGAIYSGQAKNLYQNALNQTEQPYYNNLESAKTSWENMIRQGYNTQLQNYYNSPIAFTNLGQ